MYSSILEPLVFLVGNILLGRKTISQIKVLKKQLTFNGSPFNDHGFEVENLK